MRRERAFLRGPCASCDEGRSRLARDATLRRGRRRWVHRRRQQGRSWIRVATTRQGHWSGPQSGAEHVKREASDAVLERGCRALAQPRVWRRRGECASPARWVDGCAWMLTSSRLRLGESAMETEGIPERASLERQGGRAGRRSCKGCDARRVSPEENARGRATDLGGAHQRRRRTCGLVRWERSGEGLLGAYHDGGAARGWEKFRRLAP